MMNEVRLYKEINFKDSRIGKIPRDWDIRELGDESTADIIAGQSPSSSTYNKENRGLPFFQGKMEFGEMFPSPTTYCSEPIKVAKKDDVLLSIRAPVGDVNIAPFECCIGRGLAAIRPKADRLDNLFLFHYLKFEGRRFEALSTGSTFKAIRRQEIERFLIPVPSLVEQKGIVGVLGVVDSAILKVDEVIWKTERLKKGLMQQLLTRGIGHKEYKDTPIGKTPKTWQIIRLGDVSEDFVGGGTPSTSNPEYWNGDIAWMTSAHINGRLVTTGQKYITKKGLGNSATNLVPKNNLLVATRVGIGKAAINKIDIAISQDLTGVIIIKNKAVPEFLYWILVNSGSRLKSLAQGSTIKGILREELGRLQIPLPPVAEQHRIDEILSTIDSKLELERKEKARLERVKRGLMDLLLTGKIRVKVD
jgi:type I restriction enzyme S subunit